MTTHCSTSSRARGVAKPRVTGAACGTATASPGILTATTLHCILSAPLSTEKERRRQQRSSHDDYDDADNTAVISPYDPRFIVAAQKQAGPVALTPRRQIDVNRCRHPKPETRRKRCAKKLQPMALTVPSPSPSLGRHDGDAMQAIHAVSSPTAVARSTALGNQAGSARDLLCEAQANRKQSTPVSRHKHQHQRRTGHHQELAKREFDDKLEGEIQWIHEHLPVLKLATAKCSLKLRQRLFATTILAHFTRAQLRSRWVHWRRVITHEKQQELLQLRASQRIIQLFQDLLLGLVGTRFRLWREWVLESQRQETLAACITIQRFYRQQRRRHEHAAALNLQQVLARMHEQARKIQRAFQIHKHVRILQASLRAARQIQQRVRRHQFKKRVQCEHNAALTIQRLSRRYLNRQLTHLSAMVAHAFQSHKARTIQRYWRIYAFWKHSTLPLVCVGLLVDQVEYLTAVASIQSHAIGFLCRRHLKRCHSATRRIQHCWRGFYRRQHGRRARKMEQLSQSTAACCLQRTFKRNRERAKFRKMMQKSARPMYLRACDYDREFGGGKDGDTARFRARYHVEIVKSAVSVIQSSWRKHVKYVTWKARRAVAIMKLQLFFKRAVCMSKWHGAACCTLQNQHQHVRDAAARRIQYCWGQYEARKADAATATSMRLMQELAGLVRAAICIQRQFQRRRKKDKWRFMAFRVLYEELPRRRVAVERIRRCWCAFHTRKQELLTEFGLSDEMRMSSLRGGMDLASLKQLLVAQQFRFEREQDAAMRIQKMFHRHVDKRNGKLLLQRYKVLMRQEMRKREQRKIIHGFLDERAKKQQLLNEEKMKKKTGASQGVHLSTTKSGVTATSSEQGTTTGSPKMDIMSDATMSPTLGSSTDHTSDEAKAEENGTNDEQQEFWSDEYQRAYLYNARTGESVWL